MAMKWHFEFTADWQSEPMSYWINIENEPKPWNQANSFIPPAPSVVPGKGFPVLCVEVGDFTFRFSSPEQVQACIDTLSTKPLPSSLRLSAKRPGSSGPNTHWLSRLPGSVKSPKFRAKAITVLLHANEWAKSTSFGREL